MSATPAPARVRCEVPTTCQPPSGGSAAPWPAVIRTISAAGMELTLSRRFERGSGLAIALPAEDGTTSTVFARVTGLEPFGQAGWRLDCAFVSELSEQEVEQVLHLDPSFRASLGGDSDTVNEATPPAIGGVLFQVRVRKGQWLRWFVRRLELVANWPVAPGKTLTLNITGAAGEQLPIELRALDCEQRDGLWVFTASFTVEPDPAILRLLAPPTACEG